MNCTRLGVMYVLYCCNLITKSRPDYLYICVMFILLILLILKDIIIIISIVLLLCLNCYVFNTKFDMSKICIICIVFVFVFFGHHVSCYLFTSHRVPRGVHVRLILCEIF
ncbi:hypothetical protein ES288_D03G066500v1 [Gossypium darwinii]|uniref:Uncharacterized protein n=1 Tax=Gossypium darwinii TaxID=34276 RepID=A0A5D2D399_GOSDA|nr:hypothetical protein ES288_D03G066500v1 [Gossypium darwinii]